MAKDKNNFIVFIIPGWGGGYSKVWFLIRIIFGGVSFFVVVVA